MKSARSDDLVARHGVNDGERRVRAGAGSESTVGSSTLPYGEAGAAVSKWSPTATPRPLAHSAGLSRRFPAGCTTATRTAPRAARHEHPDLVDREHLARRRASVPRGATRAPNSFTSAPRSVAHAPGFGS